jgi:hypothetical protein
LENRNWKLENTGWGCEPKALHSQLPCHSERSEESTELKAQELRRFFAALRMTGKRGAGLSRRISFPIFYFLISSFQFLFSNFQFPSSQGDFPACSLLHGGLDDQLGGDGVLYGNSHGLVERDLVC